MTETKTNPLGTESIGKLMMKFAVPSIIAMLVGSLYNIVDQFFIGQAVGTLGNAATNIAFPFSTACLSLALLFGIGGASSFNLALGRGDKEDAPYYVGNSVTMLASCGVVLMIITLVFLEPILVLFGAPNDVMPYAVDYVRYTSFGFPFLLLSTGGGHLIRADGSPKITMLCNIVGAVVNTALDALFVLVFDWKMVGAAIATVVGQVVSAVIVIIYVSHYKTVKLSLRHFAVKFRYLAKIASIGMGSFFNQLAMMVVQIVLNNQLKDYGLLSVYGESIPIACSGIVMKVSQIFFSVVIGISQGAQPIESYNYGAGNYSRVKKALGTALVYSGAISIIAYIIYRIFPYQILQMFDDGTGGELYYEFGVKFFNIFLFMNFLIFLQPVISTFFSSIGKAGKGVFLSLTRQIIFFLPLIIVLPLYMAIDGILYAAPVADILSAMTAVIMVLFELRNFKKAELNLK